MTKYAFIAKIAINMHLFQILWMFAILTKRVKIKTFKNMHRKLIYSVKQFKKLHKCWRKLIHV